MGSVKSKRKVLTWGKKEPLAKKEGSKKEVVQKGSLLFAQKGHRKGTYLPFWAQKGRSAPESRSSPGRQCNTVESQFGSFLVLFGAKREKKDTYYGFMLKKIPSLVLQTQSE